MKEDCPHLRAARAAVARAELTAERLAAPRHNALLDQPLVRRIYARMAAGHRADALAARAWIAGHQDCPLAGQEDPR